MSYQYPNFDPLDIPLDFFITKIIVNCGNCRRWLGNKCKYERMFLLKKYIGVKVIEAVPMNLVDAEEKLQRKIKPGNEEGYLVKYPDGYESWSPKDAFEEAYRLTDGLTFGLAIEALRKGYKLARAGWNGKGMFVYYIPPACYPTQTEVAKKEFGDTALYNAYLAIKNVNGTVSTWVPSINDALSGDWVIIE